MRSIYCFLLMLVCSSATFATHILGGYIRATPVAGQGLTYQITVTMYYNPTQGAAAIKEANTIMVCFGDGTTQLVDRVRQQAWPVAPATVQLDDYTTTYTYPGPGVYTVQTTISNRTSGRNIVATESAFSIRTTLQVSANATGSTPTLSLPTTGIQVAVNQRATLNVAASDTDGDSLSYELSYPLTSISLPTATACTALTAAGQYQFPNAVKQAGTYRINARTGLLTWDVPVELGNYVVAVLISKWRNGLILGQIQHEFTLVVVDKGGTPMTPPVYEPANANLLTAIHDNAPDDLLLTVSPNPTVGGMVQVILQSRLLVPAVFSLLDSQGRTQQRIDRNQPLDQHRFQLDLSRHPAGLYFIRAESGGRQVMQKVLKE